MQEIERIQIKKRKKKKRIRLKNMRRIKNSRKTNARNRKKKNRKTRKRKIRKSKNKRNLKNGEARRRIRKARNTRNKTDSNREKLEIERIAREKLNTLEIIELGFEKIKKNSEVRARKKHFMVMNMIFKCKKRIPQSLNQNLIVYVIMHY